MAEELPDIVRTLEEAVTWARAIRSHCYNDLSGLVNSEKSLLIILEDYERPRLAELAKRRATSKGGSPKADS